MGMREAKQFQLKFDYIRICSYTGEINVKKTVEQNKERQELIRRLRRSRYGDIDSSMHVTNLSTYQLLPIETEVLFKSLNFAIPPQKLKRQSIFREFEVLWAHSRE